jgi:hypothetical protein
LLKTKTKVQFDRTVTERSKLYFCVLFLRFLASQSGPIFSPFSSFRCSVGRGSQARFLGFRLIASC